MEKRHLHHMWTKLRPISYRYFLVACIVCAVIGILALRQNNLNAIKLRDNVLAVDKEDGDVEAALRELREYVYGHMNTDLASGSSIQQPVQLKYRYERLAAKEKVRVDEENSKIYNEAQMTCERQFPNSTSGGPRVPCIEAYVTSKGVKQQPIPDSLYKFSFASPRWSPDTAGLSLLFSGFFAVLFVIRFGLEIAVRSSLKQHL